MTWPRRAQGVGVRIGQYQVLDGTVRPVATGEAEPVLVLGSGEPGERWYDISEPQPDALGRLLAPLALHPLLLARCLRPATDPSVLSIGSGTLLAFPSIADTATLEPAFVTILLVGNVLVTIRHGPLPAVDGIQEDVRGGVLPPVEHLPELVYLLLDRLSDANVEVGVRLRDRIARLAQAVAERPGTVVAAELAALRAQVDRFVALIEDQQYCVGGLDASDNEALREPHQRAFIRDLAAEAESAQKAAYRLEGRVNELYAAYQLAGSDRVERRLRILTIVSATTLPLALLTGVLGMNVGGVPWTDWPYGFATVVVAMVAITVVELWFFARQGWFE